MRSMVYFSICLCLLIGLVSTPEAAFADDKKIANTKLSAEELQACLNAPCLIELAKREGKNFKSRFMKNAEKAPVIRSLFYAGNEEEALNILDNIQRIGTVRGLFYDYGWWTEGYVDQFPADGQLWTKFSPPLPESLIGRYYFFDMLFAFDAIEKKNFDAAHEIAENLENPNFKNAIYYSLASALIDKDKLEEALAYLINVEQSRSWKGAPSLPIIEVFKKAALQEQSFSIPDSIDGKIKAYAQAGIAAALATSGQTDNAMQKLANIEYPDVRELGVTYMLYDLAKLGKIDIVKELLSTQYGRNLTAEDYKIIVKGFLRKNDITNAEELISLPPTYDKAILTLSAIGAHTGNQSYFTKAFALLGQEPVWLRKVLPTLLTDMANAGYVVEAISGLSKIQDVRKRIKLRHNIYASLFNEDRTLAENDRILDAIELEFAEADNSLKKGLVSKAERFLYVDQTTPEQLARYLKLVDMLPEKEDREKAKAAVIPHFVHLGQTDKAIEILTEIDVILNRVWALTRLADYYSFKKIQDSI
ncbi:MAG: hypothetical protein NXI13_14065 [Proteobacteria bacterium]|nr:hypothetical protein [Pseudomonadota bacterium]